MMRTRPLGPVRTLGLSRAIALAGVLLAAAAVLFGAGFALSSRSGAGKAELAVLGTVPEFAFTDQDGAMFASRDLTGKVWVADFFFTRCSAACPRMTARMLQIQREVAADPALHGKVHLVSISVDPTHDDPHALAEFARGYGADTRSWTFLTGAADEVARLSQAGFLLGAAAPSPAGGDATHTDRFCLVDRSGRLRGHYRPTETAGELERLLSDLRRLVAEPAGEP